MVSSMDERRLAREHLELGGAGISSFASNEHGLRAFLAAIVSSSSDAIVGKTLDGVIWSWNAGAEALFGYSTAEAIGRSILMLIPPDRRAEEDTILARIRSGDGVPHFDTVRMRKDGTLLDVSITVSPIRDVHGNVIGASKIARDVGERKRAERALAEKEDLFRTLADNIAQFAWMADPGGSIFWYNKRWFDYTGMTLEQMQGSDWHKVHHPDHVDRVVASIRQAFESGEAWEDTFPLRAKDGAYRWFLSRAVPIRDSTGKVTRWFGTNTDISDRMEMEQALRESDRRKDEFLAMLAHELRNPLAPIRTGIALLREAGGNAQVVACVYDALDRQSLQLNRLVDDLMDVSRITRGKLELRLEAVDLRTIIEHAVETSRPLIDGGRHQLDVQLPPFPVILNADAARLSQVLSNLLNNAAKYTPDPSVIRLYAERKGSEIVVRVTDSGVGIPVSDLGHVFDLFTQLPGDNNRVLAGLGVGLTLVKQLVEMHGGRVEARSDGAGKGTEMAVCLPLPTSPLSAPLEVIPENDHAAPLRIVVADDNRDAGEALAVLLQALGHQVTLAFDGEQALEAIRRDRPELAILDVGMPLMDGLEVARHVRQEPWGQQLLLAVHTGWGRPSDLERTSAAGFDCHLVKPASRAALDEVLHRARAFLRVSDS
jgi:PAS domain S-box-containing protein